MPAPKKKQPAPNPEPSLLEQITHPNAAGIDLAAEEIVVAVPKDRAVKFVRTFGSFTSDLHEIRAWLQECRVRAARDSVSRRDAERCGKRKFRAACWQSSRQARPARRVLRDPSDGPFLWFPKERRALGTPCQAIGLAESARGRRDSQPPPRTIPFP
jgi:hypothetical protein